jgi:hypothetical protein
MHRFFADCLAVDGIRYFKRSDAHYEEEKKRQVHHVYHGGFGDAAYILTRERYGRVYGPATRQFLMAG